MSVKTVVIFCGFNKNQLWYLHSVVVLRVYAFFFFFFTAEHLDLWVNDSDQLHSILLHYGMEKWGEASVWSKLKNSSLHGGFQKENAILTIPNWA